MGHFLASQMLEAAFDETCAHAAGQPQMALFQIRGQCRQHPVEQSFGLQRRQGHRTLAVAQDHRLAVGLRHQQQRVSRILLHIARQGGHQRCQPVLGKTDARQFEGQQGAAGQHGDQRQRYRNAMWRRGPGLNRRQQQRPQTQGSPGDGTIAQTPTLAVRQEAAQVEDGRQHHAAAGGE